MQTIGIYITRLLKIVQLSNITPRIGPMLANAANNRLEPKITARWRQRLRRGSVTQTSHYATEHTMPSCSVRSELCMHSPHIKPIRPRRAD